MTAKEARELSTKKNAKDGLAEILFVIKLAVSKGEYECWYYDNIKGEARKELRELGYKVGQTQFDRNETLTKISW